MFLMLKNQKKLMKLYGSLVHDDYSIIVLSNEIASFSSDIILKYQGQDKVSFVIAPSKNV
jgi:vacuolar-type H+-ATPase subunit F/Vma7